MSYNYDECVQSIHEHRRKAYANINAPHDGIGDMPDLEALQLSMDSFANLSKHCPMTPLLWMQYAHDTEVLMEGLMMMELESSTKGDDDGNNAHHMLAKQSALETSTGILELALTEYSGSALLNLYYLECYADYMYQCEGLRRLGLPVGGNRRDIFDKIINLFDSSIFPSLGRGTHVNEGMIVSEIYRLYGSVLLFCLSSVVTEMKEAQTADSIGVRDESEPNAIMQHLVNLFQRWSQTPMGEGSNDEMMQDIEYFWDEACSLLLFSCGNEDQKVKMKQELQSQKAALWANIDEERKTTSSLTNIFSSHENEIDVAMSNEGISLPLMSIFPQQQDDDMMDSNGDSHDRYAHRLKRVPSKWNQILLDDTNRFLIGLGGVETSRAFLKSATSLQRIYERIVEKGKKVESDNISPLQDHIAKCEYPLIGSLYERAVSECPTVESVWVSYLNFLRGELIRVQNKVKGQPQQNQKPQSQQMLNDISSSLRSISHRAVRNCPYSSTLFEIRMNTLGITSVSNLEPDDITAVIQEATELGFLNHNREAMLHLRLVAILVVKRRLLSLVSLGTTSAVNGIGKDYDQRDESGVTYKCLDPTVTEEVQDLVEDIRDMYDEADNYLFKSHSTWSEGKVSYWKHRAMTEAYVLCPISLSLRKASQNGNSMNEEKEGIADKEALQCFEKLVKAQKPSHPDSWREYIKYVSSSKLDLMGSPSSSAQLQRNGTAAVVSAIRTTRGLYQRAMSSIKKAGHESTIPMPPETQQSWMTKGIGGAMFYRDYDAALSDLCREYLDFERNTGSEESFSHAQTLVRNKLANWTPATSIAPPVANGHEESHGKRKITDDNNKSVPKNDLAMGNEENDAEELDAQSKPKRVKVKTDLKQPKKTDGVHKVRVGKLEYPAHPYTIHVSKLSKETHDMDLVDAFRSEFGAIVHAKILREKNFGKGGHHFHGESKCAGLIQFEERMSVEMALQKDGEFKVGGKPVKIQRSHLPAVGVVPPGMHRVNPKGEGKVSKRNKLKKESKMKVDTNENTKMDVEDGGEGSAKQPKKNHVASPSPSSISLGVLSFKPRGMRQKPKIALDSKKK